MKDEVYIQREREREAERERLQGLSRAGRRRLVKAQQKAREQEQKINRQALLSRNRWTKRVRKTKP